MNVLLNKKCVLIHNESLLGGKQFTGHNDITKRFISFSIYDDVRGNVMELTVVPVLN
jgi:hypothetical protein